MKMRGLLILLAGGAGSGCNPDKGTCGRKPSGKFKGVKVEGLTQEHMAALKNIPSEDLKGLEYIKLVDDIKTRGRMAKDEVNVGGYQGYVDSPGTGFIRITKHADALDLTHEIGHHVWSKLTDDQRDEWNSSKGKIAVGAYTRPNKEEQFAEAYAILLSGKWADKQYAAPRAVLALRDAATILGYSVPKELRHKENTK